MNALGLIATTSFCILENMALSSGMSSGGIFGGGAAIVKRVNGPFKTRQSSMAYYRFEKDDGRVVALICCR